MPATATAHAELVASSPEANASLPESPGEIALVFSEQVDPATASVRVLDPSQVEIEPTGGLTFSEDGLEASLPLPQLEPGVYTVEYRVVSAVDGHTTGGIFAFLIDPTGTEPPPAQPAESHTPSEDPAAIGARWAALAATLALLGIPAFWLASVMPALRRHGSGRANVPALWPLLAALALLAFAGLATYLVLAARAFTDAAAPGEAHHGTPSFPLDFAAPFGWTPFAIAMRVALAGTLVCFIIAAATYIVSDEARRERRSRGTGQGPLLALVAMAAVTLGGFSGAAHAASYGGPLFAAFDWLHLLAAGLWLGGLPGFLLLAWVARRWNAVRPLLGAAARGHGRVALVAAPVVALTGIANAPIVLGESRELLASSYGNLLLAKILLFSAAVAIGSVNFMMSRAGARIRLSVIGTELAVAVVAVLAAATMITVQPAAARQSGISASAVSTAHLYGTAGASNVHATVDLPAPGTQTYQAVISDAQTGALREDVQRVFFVFEPPATSGLPAERVSLETGQPDWLWGTRGAYTPVVGDWTLEIVVRRVGELDESVRFDLPVIEPLPPREVPPPATGRAAPAPLAWLWSVLPEGRAGWGVPLILLFGAALTGTAEAWRGRRGVPVRSWWAPLRVALVGTAVISGIALGARGVVDATNAPPPAEAALTSPISADGDSLARGRNVYLANCTSCHGPDGDPAAAFAGRGASRDLATTVPGMTQGELYWTVTTGIVGTAMPGFADTLSENDRWDLVNYLRDRWPADHPTNAPGD